MKKLVAIAVIALISTSCGDDGPQTPSSERAPEPTIAEEPLANDEDTAVPSDDDSSDGTGDASEPADESQEALASDEGTAAPSDDAGFDCADGAIVIGLARSQSGGFAFFDTAGARGLEIGFDAVNDAGGIDGCPVELIHGDTQSDPALTGQVAEELIAEGAHIIIASADFDIGVGASVAAAEAGLFSFSPESSSTTWPEAVGPNHVVGGISEKALGTMAAGFADEKGWDGAYIVTNDTFSFFTKQEDAFRDIYGGEIVGRDAVANDAVDYAGVVSKIRQAGDAVEVIYLNDYFPHVGTFLAEARAAGITSAVVGNSTFSSTALPDLIGAEGLQDVYYVAAAFYEGENIHPELRSMIEAYEAKFDTFPENANSVRAYYGALILTDALLTAGSTDAEAITAAILAQKDFELPGAVYYEWIDRIATVSASIVGFDEDGNFIEIKTVDPRSYG